MYPKPPVTRTAKSGWHGRRATRLKSLAVVGALTLGFAGAAFAAAIPAMADPAFQFVAVGSDTTENVMDLFAGQTSGGIVGSYDAVNPVSQVADEIITPGVAGAGGTQLNCSFTRPNGSGQGFAALDDSLNQSTTLAQLATPPGAGCIQFSRSSGGPGSATKASSGPGVLDTSGGLVYIPFALDAVTDATGPTTAISETTQCNGPDTPAGFTCSSTTGLGTVTFTTTPTHITNAGQFTLANLKTLYGSCANVTVNGVTYNPNTASSGQQQIDLYAPQNGSGTLSFWESTMGVTAVQSCWHQTVVAGPATGVSVEEHDGSALASDPNGIAPISIAKWLAMSNGVVSPDVRHGDILQAIGGVAPVVSGNLNTSFPVVREVYNVMSFNEVTSGQSGFSPVLAGLFAGSGSALCQSTFSIEQEGFGALPSPSTPDNCGSTANSLRVQETNNGPS
jgi:phosphate transport system substrate-binding protein